MNKNVFVVGIPYQYTDSELKNLFAKYGAISARVFKNKADGRSMGRGLVTLENDEQVRRSINDLHGSNLDGRPLVVKEDNGGSGAGRNNDKENDQNVSTRGDKGRAATSNTDIFQKNYPNGYSNQSGELDLELFSTKAEKIAKNFGNSMSFTKIRQYYDEVNSIFHSLEKLPADPALLQESQLRLHMLVGKVTFDSKRQGVKIAPEFPRFIECNVRQVKDVQSFRLMKRHFEAVVSYARVYCKQY
jgi:CRISPR type III-A-associated protein Csm2